MSADVDLAVCDTPGDGTPIVLLHGLASTHRWWDLVAAHLPSRRVLRWDHRSHGRSATPPGRPQLDDLTADAAALLDKMHLRGCVLVGHSLGAGVALALAARRPDLAAAVCCIDGGLYDPKLMFGGTWWDAQQALRLDRRIAPTEAMLTAWAAGAGLPAAAVPALLANYEPETSQAAGSAALSRFRLRLAAEHEGPLAHSLWSQDPAAALACIAAPVTAVIAGTTNPAAAALRRRALHHTVHTAARPVAEIWLDGGHDLPLEQPDVLARIIAALADTAIPTGSPT